MAHALLSPSAAHRWLTCTPSAKLEAQFPDSAGEAAKEGTLAHELADLLIKSKTSKVKKALFAKELKRIQSDDLYNEAMYEHCDNYATFVLEQFAEAQSHTRDALLFTEQKVDLTEFIPEGFGTRDCAIIADQVLTIIDLKYGKGVFVTAEQNKQMMLYALGSLREFDFMYNILKVRMIIYQPRIDNYSSWELEVGDLLLWGLNELKPKAKLAFAGEGELVAGSHCQFCRLKATCRKHHDMQMELAKHDFQEAVLLSDIEIVQILGRMASFRAWLAAVEDHALHEAVHNGKKWPGYKLVEGRSVRKYTDTEAIIADLTTKGYNREDITEPATLLGITKLEKLIGKSEFSERVAPFTIKPPGKPTLVPVTDKRPELNSLETAITDFENVQID